MTDIVGRLRQFKNESLPDDMQHFMVLAEIGHSLGQSRPVTN